MWHLQMICSKFAIEVNPFFRPVLSPLTPMESICEYWTTLEMKQGHIGLDSAFDLWLLGHFKLRIFRLSHGASRTGLWSLVLSLTVGNSGLKEIAQIAMDWKNNHTANKKKQSKYGKLYFIEHSSEYLSIWIFYLNSPAYKSFTHFKLRNMKLHVLMIELIHWAWAASDLRRANLFLNRCIKKWSYQMKSLWSIEIFKLKGHIIRKIPIRKQC